MISIHRENNMVFILKYKLLWIFSLCLAAQAHNVHRRVVRDVEDPLNLPGALRTPQKYIIEPIQTLTKSSDNLEAPPYDAVDFGTEDKFNEIEGKTEESDNEGFLRSGETANPSFRKDANKETKDSPETEIEIQTKTKAETETEYISKESAFTNSEAQSEKLSKFEIIPVIVTENNGPDSKLPTGTDSKNLLSDSVNFKDKNKLLQNSVETNVKIKMPSHDNDSVKENNRSDDNNYEKPTEVSDDTNSKKSTEASNDKDTKDSSMKTQSTSKIISDSKAPQTDKVLGTVPNDNHMPLGESQTGIDSKNLFSDLVNSVDKDTLQNYVESNKNSENSNKEKDPVIEDLTLYHNELRIFEILDEDSEKHSEDSNDNETKVSETKSEKELGNNSQIKSPETEKVSKSEAKPTVVTENYVPESELGNNSKNPSSESVDSVEKTQIMQTHAGNNSNIKIPDSVDSAVEDLTLNLKTSNDKPSEISKDTETRDSQIKTESSENKTTNSVSKNSEDVAKLFETKSPVFATNNSLNEEKLSESKLPIYFTNDYEKSSASKEFELPIEPKNFFDSISSLDDKLMQTYSNENSGSKIPNKVSEADNSVAEDLSHKQNSLRIFENQNVNISEKLQGSVNIKVQNSENKPNTSEFEKSVLDSELKISENLSKPQLEILDSSIKKNSAKPSDISNDSEVKLIHLEKPAATNINNSENLSASSLPHQAMGTKNTNENIPEKVKPISENVSKPKDSENTEAGSLSQSPESNSENVTNSDNAQNNQAAVENVSPSSIFPVKAENNAKPSINNASNQETFGNLNGSLENQVASGNVAVKPPISSGNPKPNKPVTAVAKPKPSENVPPIPTISVGSPKPNKPVTAVPKPQSSENVPAKPAISVGNPKPNKPITNVPKPKPTSIPDKPIRTTIKPLATEKPVRVVYISTTAKPVKEITPPFQYTTAPPTKKPTPNTTKRPAIPVRTTRRPTRRPIITRRPSTNNRPPSRPSSPNNNNRPQPINNQNIPVRKPQTPTPAVSTTTTIPTSNPAWFPGLPSLPGFPQILNPGVSTTNTTTSSNPAWFPALPSIPGFPLTPTPGVSTTNTTTPSNPTWFPGLPSFPGFPSLQPPSVLPTLPPLPPLPAFLVNPFNTTTRFNQTQSTFGIGFLAVPWNWRPRDITNFTNLFIPTRIIDTPPPLQESRDLAFWNALFHKGMDGTPLYKDSMPKVNITNDTNANATTTTTSWKPWNFSFFKMPKFSSNANGSAPATIPANTQVLHIYFPLKFPFQGQIITSPEQEENVRAIKKGAPNKIETTPKSQKPSVKSVEVESEKKVEIVADNAEISMTKEKSSLMFELELPKPIARFVKNIWDTFMPQNM